MDRDSIAVDFGNLLNELRSRKGIGVNQLAGSLGISNQYMSLLLRGKQGPPSAKVIIAAAHHLDVNEYELLCDAGQLHPDLVESSLRAQRAFSQTLRSTRVIKNNEESEPRSLAIFVDLWDLTHRFSNKNASLEYAQTVRQAVEKLTEEYCQEVRLRLAWLLQDVGRGLARGNDAPSADEGTTEGRATR